MTKRRIEISRIEDNAKRHTTFAKRRQGLHSKSKSFADKFGAEVAVITFSQAGNAYGFGHPSVDSLIRRYLDQAPKSPETSGADSAEEEKPTAAPTEGEMKNRIRQALDGGVWDLAAAGLGLRELDELSSEIVKMRRAVAARADEILARDGSSKASEGGVSRPRSRVESVIGGKDGES